MSENVKLAGKIFASKEAVGKPIYQQIGGRYIEGGFFRRDRIEVVHGNHVMTLTAERDTESNFYSTVLSVEVRLDHSVMIGLLRNWPGQTIFSLMVSMFGLQKTAVDGVSNDCIILSKVPARAQQVLGDEALRGFIHKQPQLMLSVGLPLRRSSNAEGKRIRVAVPTVVQEPMQLESLVDLTRRLIDVLSENPSGVGKR